MPDRHSAGPVNEQDLHMARGAYDQVHHAHGYRWKAEPHHWYWFAGVAAACVFGIAGLTAFVMYDRAMPPLCSRSDSDVRISPDGSKALETVLVTCGGEASRKVLMYPAGGSAYVPAVASFDEAAQVRARWRSDSEVMIRKSGGRVWNFRLFWKDVRLHFDDR